MGLGTISLQTIIVVLAGFLVGLALAALTLSFIFGRRYESARRAIQLSCERQVAALRATLSRMMERIDALTDERVQLQRSNDSLREAVRDQHRITDQAGQELEEAQQNVLRLQERVDELQAQTLRQEGRLEQARIHEERMGAQLHQVIDQFNQTRRLQRNLLFAARQLHESRVSNRALETRLQQGLKPVNEGDTTSVAQLDVALIEGLEPEHAQRLHDSGIHTIGDLARQTPARVAHFAGLTSWDDSAAWIAEAKLRLAGSSQAQA